LTAQAPLEEKAVEQEHNLIGSNGAGKGQAGDEEYDPAPLEAGQSGVELLSFTEIERIEGPFPWACQQRGALHAQRNDEGVERQGAVPRQHGSGVKVQSFHFPMNKLQAPAF
jgi:hypothetical protein